MDDIDPKEILKMDDNKLIEYIETIKNTKLNIMLFEILTRNDKDSFTSNKNGIWFNVENINELVFNELRNSIYSFICKTTEYLNFEKERMENLEIFKQEVSMTEDLKENKIDFTLDLNRDGLIVDLEDQQDEDLDD